MDRVSDGAVLGSLAWYLHSQNSKLEVIVLLNILAGFLISYVKARAESLGFSCNGGFAERTERLIITLVATGLAGLGINYVLALGMWFLLLASVFTVFQRFLIVKSQNQ
jgi:CDP-diacylglycerol--glycerol-3-phosphate 3-phosphatidyltransferase